MATALAAQLQALATSTEGSNSNFAKPNTRASILFDARHAADIDIATIFSLAVSGLEELAKANPMFSNFKKTLFSVESCQTDRELQGQDFNVNLNASIRSFLCLVADFLLLSPAHQTLEYLIRRYKIHIYNVEDLIRFVLPYHETSLFVRIVQLSNIEKTRWRFLEGVKKSGAAPLRDLLVQQCLNDMSVLEGICESGHSFKIGSKALRGKTTYSFSVAMVVEVLNANRTVNSMLVNMVLSYVTHSFDKGSSEETEVGGLMIIGTLINNAKVSEDTLAVLFDLITRVLAHEASPLQGGVLHEMAVMVLIQIVQTQTVKVFPEKAFRSIVKVRDLSNILSKISTFFDAERALTILINGLIRNCLSSPHFGQVLQEILDAVPLKGLAESIMQNVLDLVLERLESQDVMDGGSSMASDVVKVILAIKDRFPEEVDQVTHKFLESHTGAKDTVVSLLNMSFKGSLHTILPESNQSINRSLQHPQSHVRMLAIQRVVAIAKNDIRMNSVCSEALLLGLRDTDLSVVESVLSVDGLANLIDCDELFSSQASLIERCVTILEKGPRSLRAEAISAGKRCLCFLSSNYLEAFPSYAERVGHVLLSNVLLFSKSWKLNLTAVKAAKQVQWNLFEGLSALEDESLQTREKIKEKKAWLHELNTKVIDLLATSLSENLKSLSAQVIGCATKFKRAKPLVVLVLLQSLTRIREGLNWEMIKDYLFFLEQEWIQLETSDEFATYKLKNEEIFEEKIFSRDFLKTLQKNPKFALTSLLLQCFYKVLKCIPETNRRSRKDYEDTICSVLKELFEFFSSPHSKTLFEEHSKLLLKKLPISPIFFFSSFFNAEVGTLSVSVQINSLNWFLYYCNDAINLQKIDVQVAVPYLLVALANPVKGIRRAAFECLMKLFERWRENTVLFILPNGSQIQKKLLDSESFETLMECLMEYRDSFISNAEFLSSFFSSLLGFSNGQKKNEADSDSTLSKLRFKKPIQFAIYQFLLHNALTLPMYAQATLVISLKGAVGFKDQAIETKKTLASLLQRWRDWKLDKSNQKDMSTYEVQLFRHLLQIHLHYEGMFSVPNGKARVPAKGKLNSERAWFRTLMEVLNIEKGLTCLDVDAIETLCTALSCLEERIFKNIDNNCQDTIFERLVELSLLKSRPVQFASRAALQKLWVQSSTVVRYISGLLKGECNLLDESMTQAIKPVVAVLEFLLSGNDIRDMHELVPCLFGFLRKLNRVYALCKKGSTENDGTKHVDILHVNYAQQLILEVLEKIMRSTQSGVQKETIEKVCEVNFLVEFIHGITDVTTLNQALGLLTTLARLSPDLVLEHVISVLSVMGETTLIQEDSHSYIVVEKLVAAVIPNWLERMKNPRLLLQIFVKALPDIPNHRRIPFFKTTLRLMQESTSLHVLFLLLLERKLLSKDADKNTGKRKSTPESDKATWLEAFSNTFCEEYELPIRLPALLNLLIDTKQEVADDDWKLKNTVINFISKQLQKKGFLTELRSNENEVLLRATLIKMLEEVLSLLQSLSMEAGEKKTKSKKPLHDNASHLLESITSLLSPQSFAEAVIHILQAGNKDMKIRALGLIATKMKVRGAQDDIVKRKRSTTMNLREEDIPEDMLTAYESLIQMIGSVLDKEADRDSVDVMLPAIAAVHSCSERLAKKIPSAFVANLRGLVKLSQHTSPCAPASLQCMATIIMETGFNVLPMLGELITRVIATSGQHSLLSLGTTKSEVRGAEPLKEADLQMAILNVLEAAVQNLGNFLSPYLGQILELLLLESCFISSTNRRLVEKAEFVRCLLPKTIPVRLLLEPLISMYDRSLNKGEASLLACLNMLSLVVSSLEKSSVLAHYKTVFELCLRSFDLRRIHPTSLDCVTVVETSVISLFSSLVLKLSESTFKPLFVKILEWAEMELPSDDEGKESKQSVLRGIVFYRIVNQLADKLRSVFIPYFQYLLKGCVRRLTDGHDKQSSKTRKKLKVSSSEPMKFVLTRAEPTRAEWHLCYLVVSALHKCFLYDSIGFVDTQKFAMLLGPLVQQITVEKPGLEDAASDGSEWAPSIEDMDSVLVTCLGQMAITAGTDLLWKPLNHEVLLCTRSDALRARLLSLDIVKFLVDNLKEDYLALLPETIPFLAELLEDHDLTVVSKSQDIIKILEELSGESLSQYL